MIYVLDTYVCIYVEIRVCIRQSKYFRVTTLVWRDNEWQIIV